MLSAWCGLISGTARSRGPHPPQAIFFDFNHLYGMSRHFVWLIPLTDLLVFLAFGIVRIRARRLEMAHPRWVGWPRGGSSP